MFKVGIDLSTTNTGVVVLNELNDLVYKKDVLFRTFNEANYIFNMKLIKECVEEIINATNQQPLLIGIELANFQNAQLTSRFSLYAGIWMANFEKHNENLTIKTFNANQWQIFVGVNVGKDTRDITKMKSRLFVKEHCKQYNENWSEDLCDAYCIAYFVKQTLSNEQKTIEVKRKNYQNKLVKSKQLELMKQIETKYKKINQLDYNKNWKRINTLKKEIEILRSKYENLK